MKFLLIVLIGLSSFILPSSAALPAIWCMAEDFLPDVCDGYEETITGSLATELNKEIKDKNIETDVFYPENNLTRNLRRGNEERELINCSYCTLYPESWCAILCPGWRRLQESPSTEDTCKDLVKTAQKVLKKVATTIDDKECEKALKAATCGCEE
jgi:hypothetical protein